MKTYFFDFPQPQPSKPQPRDYSYQEWLRIELGHTNVIKSVRNPILNKWVLDSFSIKADYGKHMTTHTQEVYPCHDEGFEKEEQRKCGIEKTDYELPFVDIETFEIKIYSFEGGRSFVYITKQLDDALPLGRVKESRFLEMIRKKMNKEGGTQGKTKEAEFKVTSTRIHIGKMLLFRHNHSSYAVTDAVTM
uniref:Uncharacterized protein n=1 Tax=Tanacetum cinerariifolium TaxID=118510 RepID=A0A6L2JGZ6_TANCI|nr:hypothetical protein [Tanacetum cinerariifolium]